MATVNKAKRIFPKDTVVAVYKPAQLRAIVRFYGARMDSDGFEGYAFPTYVSIEQVDKPRLVFGLSDKCREIEYSEWRKKKNEF